MVHILDQNTSRPNTCTPPVSASHGFQGSQGVEIQPVTLGHSTSSKTTGSLPCCHLMKTIISPPSISVPLADLVHNSSAEDTQPVLFTSRVRVCFIILLKIHSSHAVVSAMPVLTALSLPQHGKMSGTRHKNYSMVSHGDVFAWLHCSNRLMTPI